MTKEVGDLTETVEELKQLRDHKASEARSKEVINILVKERVKIKRQLELEQEMTEELEATESKKEAGEKEGPETAHKKLKHLSIPWFQTLIEHQRTKEHQPKIYNGIFL
ncbi:hypothetical protein Q7C36_006671 [Tachysurus vachellii]|uniref:Uncharacterized protein n=1 Tax=Tachysurus vachellii TaxID=175792 RepID=A0AA88NEQ5_TACVA|nr:hypothetical protein Q7C36_006671 [Tachysurus vachellii]